MRGLLQGGLALASLIVGTVLLLKPPELILDPNPHQAVEIEKGEAPPLADPQEDLAPLPEGALTDDYIQQTLARQSRFLRSCFLKYFDRAQGQIQSGHTLLNIQIESTGRVRAADIVRSDVEDDGYTSCLQSVVLRTRFRPFHGPPLHVEYPIELRAPSASHESSQSAP